MRSFVFILIVLFSFCNFVKASDFKVDRNLIELKFNQAVEVSLFDSKLLDNTRQEFSGREINQNIVGVLAICCGAFGLQRFYMGHTDAGIKHLATTFVLGGMLVLAAYLITNNSNYTGTSYNTKTDLASTGLYLFAYCGSSIHVLYNFVEGVLYLTMPEEKFQSRIVKDPRFFAAFSRN